MQNKTKKRIYRWGGGVAGVIILVAVLVALLPFGVKWWINDWLSEQGLVSELERVHINLWRGEFGIRELKVTDDDKQTLHVGELGIELDLGELFEKSITIRDLRLKDAFVNVHQGAQGMLSVAGIALGGTASPSPETKLSEPWDLKLRGLQLQNIEACYQLKPKPEASGTDGCARMKSLRWTGTLEYMPTLKQQDVQHLLQGEVDLAMEEFETDTEAGQKFALSFDGLSLNDVDVNSIGEIRLGEVVLSSPSVNIEGPAVAEQTWVRNTFDMNTLRLKDINIRQTSEITIDTLAFDEPAGVVARTRENGSPISNNVFKMKSLLVKNLSLDKQNSVSIDTIGISQYLTELELFNETGKPGKDYKIGATDIELGKVRFSPPQGVTFKGLHLNNVSVSDEGDRHNPIARLSSANFSGFEMQGTSNIALGGLVLDKIGLFFVGADAQAIDSKNYHQFFKRIAISNVALRELTQFELADLIVEGAHLTLERSDSGALVFERPIKELVGGDDAKEKKEIKTEETTPVEFKAKKLRVNGDSELTIIDRSFKNSVERRAHNIAIEVSDLDSSNSDHQSPFSLSMLLGKNGDVRLEGKGTLFSPRPTIDAKGKIRGVDLGKYSAYAEQIVRHQIQSGLLDADLDINIKQGELDSLIDLTLYKFYIDAAPKQDTQYEKELGMPLSTALSLLREKDDSIHIKLPVTGDITSPDFSLQHVIQGVMADAIKQAIINYYTPFGVVTLAGAAFDFLTALRFKPVEFEPGEGTLDDGDRAALDKIASMLKEREKVRLVVCGKAVLEDRIKLFDIEAEEAEKMRAALRSGPDTEPDLSKLPSLSEQQTQRLNALADERTAAVKAYLVEQGTISPNRLIECNPQYDPAATGTPRTVIGV